MLGTWLALSSTSHALPLPPSFDVVPVTMERHIDELCFPSGLRVTVVRDDRAPVVGVTAVVGRGAAHDAPDKAGATHLLEHLWFRARVEGQASVSDRLHAEGALSNAFTLTDATVYFTVVPRGGLPLILPSYGALVTNPLIGIGPTELASEQDIVASEDRASQLDALDALGLLPDGIFPEGHPYRSLAPTTAETVHAVTLADLRAIVGTSYRPDLVTLQVIGNITPDDVRTQIEATFPAGALWNGPDGKPRADARCDAQRIALPEPAPPAKQPVPIVQVEADVDHPSLVVAWRLPAASSHRGNLPGAAVRHLDYVVRELAFAGVADVERLDPQCRMVDGLQATIALCTVQLEDGESALKWKHRVAGSLKYMRSGDKYENERVLKALQALMEAHIVDSLETLSGLEDDHALAWALTGHFTGTPDYYHRALDGLSGVTWSALQQFQDTWLARDAAWAIHVLPRGSRHVDEGSEIDEDAASSAATTAVRPVAVRPSTPAGAHAGLQENATDLDVLAALERREPEPLTLPTKDAKVLHLDTGLTVVIVPHGTVPVVRMALVFGGAGAADEPAPGAQALRAWMTYREQGKLDAGHVRTAGRIGGEWLEWPDVHTRSTMLRASSGNLDGALYLMRSYIENTVLSTSMQWRQVVNDSLGQFIDARASRVDEWERSLRLVPVLGDQTLAWSWLERAWTGSAKATGADLVRWERATARPETSTLYIVGNVDPSAAEPLVHEYFDSWKPGGKAWEGPATPKLPAPPPRTVLVLDDPREDEAVVSASCRADATTRATRDVAAGTLEWLAWQALRLAPDLAAYNPSVSVESDDSSFAVYTIGVNVRADQAGRAVQSVLGTYAGAGNDARVVSFVRGDLRRKEQVRWLTTADILDGLIVTSGARGDLAAVPAYFDGLARADPRTALTGCVGHEVITVRGPAGSIEESLRASGVTFSRTDVAAYVHSVRQRTVH